MRQKQKQNRGFTLTEIAIVLGVVGLILGAIWAAAASVASKHRLEQGTNQVWQIALNVRSIYKGHPFPTLNVDVTPQMIAQKVITQDMIDPATGLPINPWGGGYAVAFATPSQFYITVTQPVAGWPAAVCSDMISRLQAVGTASTTPVSATPVPVPAPPAADTTQGGAPTNAYFFNGAGWADATGRDAEAVAAAMAGGCGGVAYYFTI